VLRERVVEVLGPGEDGTPRRFGSGYLLDARHLLTARHVAEGGEEGFEARPLGCERWIGARRIWRGEDCDAALLELSEPAERVGTRVRLGRIAGTAAVPCAGVGFPEAQAREDEEQVVYDTEQIEGRIQPLGSAKRGQLAIHVESGAPRKTAEGSSPWRGASGAAVFSGALLVGVLKSDTAKFETDRIQATPLGALAAEPGFRVALGVGGPLVLEAVEAEGVLEQPYERRPSELPVEASSYLLGARYGAVPFRAREELQELEGWCAGEPGLGLALLTGRGGTGKTRLGAELCRRVAARGGGEWVTGLLAPRPRGEGSSGWARSLAGIEAPLLVVVDYAETRREQLGLLLERLAAAPDQQRPVRVLLIARAPGDWWQELARAAASERVRIKLGAATLRTLDEGQAKQAERPAEYEHALESFARLLGGEPPAARAPDLSAPLFERVLFVHMAALSALEADREQEPARPIRPRLLGEALEREARYWRQSAHARELGIDDYLCRRAVALATLATPTGEAEAARLLAVIPDLAGEQALRHRVARWLHDLYPSASSWAGALEPDLVGEALIGDVLESLPALAPDLLAQSDERTSHRALTVLTRAARDHDNCRQALADALAAHFGRIWPTAIVIAQETGDPIGRLLAETLEREPSRERVEAIASALPEQTVALRELAAAASRQIVEALRDEIGDVEAHPRLPDLATSLNNLSNRLGELGRREQALAAIEEAVAIRRRLAEARPDAFLPDLASSLNNLSIRLGELGRREQALAAIEEAVASYRRLAEARPDAFLPNLAMSLNTLSNRLGELGRREQALAAIEEAVAIHRRLAEARPDAFLPNLASSLNNLSNRLGELGRREQALAASEEAARLRGPASETRMDTGSEGEARGRR